MATSGKQSGKQEQSAKFEKRCLDTMKKGTQLIKVRPSNRRYQRKFSLDEGFTSLKYDGSTKIQWFHKLRNSSPDMSIVSITDIEEVREGAVTDTLINAANNKALHVSPDCCFSLVIRPKHKTLDLIAGSRPERDIWVHGLRHLIKKYSEADIATQEELWRKELFRFTDKDGDGSLTFKEIFRMMAHLNISTGEMAAMGIFQAANINASKNKRGEPVLDEDEFVRFIELLQIRPELENLFTRYNYGGSYWNANELAEFLQNEQFMKITERDCKELIDKYEQCPHVKSQGWLSKNGFYSMMHAPQMSILNPEHTVIYQDMTQPMSDYFIDSSHNTYLLADQLVGESAVEAYIRALKRGCRCVELDCWDGDNGEPVIYHGHTLTSKILFSDTVRAINEYAFTLTEYPLILSIENHCSVEQQKKMAIYMKKTFGDKLLTEPLFPGANALPSPESLKGRIVVKAKKIPENSTDGEVSDEDEAADIQDEKVRAKLAKEKRGDKLKLATKLSDCVVICQSVSFKSFAHSRDKYTFAQMSSFAEGKATGLAEERPIEYIQHNQWQISRIYPTGLRTDSSNYDPFPMWNTGCQIVALNYQTPDEPMQWNMGRFIDNGRCGYVLKPDFLRNKETMFNPNSNTFPSAWKKKVAIKVISGWQLPKQKGAGRTDIVDPYVKLEVAGVKVDQQSFKTDYVSNNGFNPVWNEEFEFEVQVPELALLRFQVKDHASSSSNELIAIFCLPVNSLQQGYRSVPLQTKYNDSLWPSSLLVHVTIQ